MRKVTYLTVLVFLLSGMLWAEIPRQINIQGQLSDTTGTLLADGNYDLTFSIYSMENTNAPVFTETANQIMVQNGVFSYLLGTNATLNLPFGVEYWLGIQVGTSNELLPRQKIVSVGNSFKSLNSDYAQSANTSELSFTANTALFAITAGSSLTADSATNAINANTAELAYTSNTALYLSSADNIGEGILSDVRLSNNVSLLNKDQIFSGVNVFGTVTANSTWSVTSVQSALDTKNIWMLDTVNAPYVNSTVLYALTAGTLESASIAQNALIAYTALTAETLISAANILSGTLASERLQGVYGQVTAKHSFTSDSAYTALLALSADSATNAVNANTAGLSYIANTAFNLTSAANILEGVLAPERLQGVYGQANVNHAFTSDSANTALIALSANSATNAIHTNTAELAYNSNTALNLSSAANILEGILASERLQGIYGQVTAKHSFTSETANIAELTYNSNTAFNLTSADNILGGTLADVRLSTNVPLLNKDQIFSGVNVFGTVTANSTWSVTSVQSALDTKNIWMLDTVNAPYVNSTVLYALTAGTLESASIAQNALIAYSALTAETLISAANILSGTLASERLQGVYGRVTVNHAFTSDSAYTALLALSADSATNAVNANTAGLAYNSNTALNLSSAANILGGTLADARLSTNVPLLNKDQIFSGVNVFGTVTANSTWSVTSVQSALGTKTIWMIDTVNATFINSTVKYALAANTALISLSATTAINALSANTANLAYTSNTAVNLTSAVNILGGVLASERLQGIYGQVTAKHSFTSATANMSLISLSANSATNAINANTAILAYTSNTALNLSSASNILGGTLVDARLSTNVSLLNKSQQFTGINVFGIVTANNTWSVTSVQSALSTKNIWMLDTVNATYVNSTVKFALAANTALISLSATSAVNAISANTANLAYTSNTAVNLTSASNILGGVLASDRLQGIYGQVTSKYSYTSETATVSNWLSDASHISSGTILDGRLSDNIPRLDASNEWTGSSNTFDGDVNVSVIKNNIDTPLQLNLSSNMNVSLPYGKIVTFGLKEDDNKHVIIGTGDINSTRGYNAQGNRTGRTGYLNLLGPALVDVAGVRMRLYHDGDRGIIDTGSSGGSIYINPINHILTKSMNSGELPIGVMESYNSGSNYNKTGSFGGPTTLGGTVTFTSKGFRSLSNCNYDVHLQVIDTSTANIIYSAVVKSKTTDSFTYKVINQSGQDVTSSIYVDWRVFYYE